MLRRGLLNGSGNRLKLCFYLTGRHISHTIVEVRAKCAVNARLLSRSPLAKAGSNFWHVSQITVELHELILTRNSIYTSTIPYKNCATFVFF